MTKRDEAIETAARELLAAACEGPRGEEVACDRLRAALALPVDPPAPVEERERALVREAWCRGAVVAGQMSPEGTSRPDDVQLREWLASDDYGWLPARHPGMTPSDAIAAVDRTHPRAPASDRIREHMDGRRRR